MNNIKISFILCSRKRPERLLKFISSVYETADTPDEIEILIKFDDDDLESISNIEKYNKYPNVRIFIGPRLTGYDSIEIFLNKMSNDTSAHWISFANDDTYLIGKGWDTQLKNIKEKKCRVYPNKHQLVDSIYEENGGTPFYFVPNQCWKQYGVENITHPFDTILYNILVSNNWTHKFIDLLWVHQRDSDYLLELHRKL